MVLFVKLEEDGHDVVRKIGGGTLCVPYNRGQQVLLLSHLRAKQDLKIYILFPLHFYRPSEAFITVHVMWSHVTNAMS